MADELQSAVEKLGLQKFKRHIFLCADQTEAKCCSKEQGMASWEFLKQRLNDLARLSDQGQLLAHLCARANCGRLP